MANQPSFIYNEQTGNTHRSEKNMKKFFQRLLRSYFGTLVIYRFFKKIWRVAVFKQAVKKRRPGVLLTNVQELNDLMQGHAYLHDLEVPSLARYAQNADRTIVEIGCAFGASSAIFLAHMRQGITLHSIDPFIVDSMGSFQATQEKCTRNVRRVLKALGCPEKINQWKLHPDYSYNIAKQWNTPVDLLFIDGDHRYGAVRKDFDEWFPFVKIGGIILFHDSRKEAGTPKDTFNRGWSGPTQLVQELSSNNRVKLIDETYSITVWEKTI